MPAAGYRRRPPLVRARSAIVCAPGDADTRRPRRTRSPSRRRRRHPRRRRPYAAALPRSRAGGSRGMRAVAPLAVAAIVLGMLLGGRESAEDGRSAAAAALAGGDPAQAVSLDEAVAGRSGFLMLLRPGRLLRRGAATPRWRASPGRASSPPPATSTPPSPC